VSARIELNDMIINTLNEYGHYSPKNAAEYAQRIMTTVDEYIPQVDCVCEAQEALWRMRGVAEVIEANGIKWAADSIRRVIDLGVKK